MSADAVAGGGFQGALLAPTDLLAPQGVEFSFDLAQHLVSTAAGARTPNGRYGVLRTLIRA